MAQAAVGSGDASNAERAVMEPGFAGVELADLRSAIANSQNLEDWRREQMLSDLESLVEFYRRDRHPSSDATR